MPPTQRDSKGRYVPSSQLNHPNPANDQVAQAESDSDNHRAAIGGDQPAVTNNAIQETSSMPTLLSNNASMEAPFTTTGVANGTTEDRVEDSEFPGADTCDHSAVNHNSDVTDAQTTTNGKARSTKLTSDHKPEGMTKNPSIELMFNCISGTPPTGEHKTPESSIMPNRKSITQELAQHVAIVHAKTAHLPRTTVQEEATYKEQRNRLLLTPLRNALR